MRIEIRVDGVPPLKNEAKSLLSAGHNQSERVLVLLDAARASTVGLGMPVFPEGQLALEMIILAPSQPTGDATNYLGGVGDVLQVKGLHGSHDHLGVLAQVAIYTNDSQLQEVHYRWQKEATSSYQITISRRAEA